MMQVIRVLCQGLHERQLAIVQSLLRLLDGRHEVKWVFLGEMEAGAALPLSPDAPASGLADDLGRYQVLVLGANQPLDGVPRHLVTVGQARNGWPAEEAGYRYHLADAFRPTELLAILNEIEQREKVAGHASASTASTLASPDLKPVPVSEQAQHADMLQGALQPVSIFGLLKIRRSMQASEQLDLFEGQQPVARMVTTGLQGPEAGVMVCPKWKARTGEALAEAGGEPLPRLYYRMSEKAIGAGLQEPFCADWEIIGYPDFCWMLVKYFCRTPQALGITLETRVHLRRWPDFGFFRELAQQKGVLATTGRLNKAPESLAKTLQSGLLPEAVLCQLLGLCRLLGYLEYHKAENHTAKNRNAEARQTGADGAAQVSGRAGAVIVDARPAEPATPSVFDFVRRLRARLGLF